VPPAAAQAINVTPELLHTQAADLIRDAITLREATTAIDAALTEAQAQPSLQVATISSETHLAFTDNLLLGSIAVAETAGSVEVAASSYVETETTASTSFDPRLLP
jgi:hypothetical protein